MTTGKVQTEVADADLQRARRKTRREIDQVGEQLKKIYRKLGLTDEVDSIERVLRKRFGIRFFAERGIVSRHGELFEIDAHAYNDNEFYLVSVCCDLRSEDIEYLLTKLKRLPKYYPEHAHRSLYGIIAASRLSKPGREEALGKGLYVGIIKDEKFRLRTPPDFQPKDYRRSAKKAAKVAGGGSRKKPFAGRKKRLGK